MSNGFIKVSGLNLVSLAADPASGAEGDLYYNNVSKKIRVYLNSTWHDHLTADDTQTLTNKTIDAASNTISNIANANISSSAAVGLSKLAALTPSRALTTDGSGVISASAVTSTELSKLSGVTSALIGASDTVTLTNKSIDATTNTISNIANANVATGAAIAVNKLAALGTNAAVVTDGSGVLGASAVTATELGRLSGVTSSVQTQITSNNTLITTHTGASSGVHGLTGTVVGTSDTQSLTNKTISDALTLAQVGTPANPAASFNKLYAKSDGKLYTLDSGGTEKAVGSGAGAGATEYNTNTDFESNTTGYVTYADGAAIPVDGVGGSPSLTITRSTTTPLHGNASGVITPGALGDGVAFSVAIDRADQAKMVTVSFDYQVVSGTLADGDYTVWAYDTSANAQLIQLAPYRVLGNLGFGKYQGTFQSNYNSTSYRILIHQAVASTATLRIDNVSCQPVVKVFGAPVTDLQPYAATLDGATSTLTDMRYSRMGDRLYVCGSFNTLGGANGSLAALSLPPGLSVDTTKLAGQGNKTREVGYWQTVVGSGTATSLYTSNGIMTVDTGTPTKIFLAYASQSGAFVVQTGLFYWGGTERVTVEFSVPILGWGSSVQLSQDVDTRVCAALLVSGSNQSITTATETTINLDTARVDTHGAFNPSTHQYTVQIPGIYSIQGTIHWQVSGAGIRVARIYKNGVIVTDSPWPATASNFTTAYTSTTVKLVAGDVVEFRGYQDSGGSLNSAGTSAGLDYTRLEIKRLSGPAAISASESVYASYVMSGSKTGSPTAPYDFDTKVFDSHGMVTTGASWKATAPIAGVYRISVLVNPGANPSNYLDLFKNGSLYSFLGYTGGGVWQGTRLIKLLAGDYIDIRAEASVTTTSDTRANYIDIERVGN